MNERGNKFKNARSIAATIPEARKPWRLKQRDVYEDEPTIIMEQGGLRGDSGGGGNSSTGTTGIAPGGHSESVR
eukprot:SAG22_NODE_879_length_6707_cov_14.725787_8_plen_73_part_01